MADSSARWLLRQLKGGTADGGYVGLTQDVLRQTEKPQERSKLDEIADSLASRARSQDPRVGNMEHSFMAFKAASMLVVAGLPAGRRGTPYDGAYDRLNQIARDSRADMAARGVAIDALLQLATPTQRPSALAYISDLIVSSDPAAMDGVRALERQAGGGSLYVDPTPAQMAEAWTLLHGVWDVVRQDPDKRPHIFCELEWLALGKKWTLPEPGRFYCG